MKVKVTQSYAVNYQGTRYETGDCFDVDEATAARLIEQQRAVEVKSLKTDEKQAEQVLLPEERQAKIKAAIAELLSANPDDKPKCPDIAAKTGIKDVSAAERDAIWAELKQVQTGQGN